MSSVTEQEHRAILNCDTHPTINGNLNNDNNIHTESTLHENDESVDSHAPLKITKDIKNDNSKAYRTRACSERSDSGISDCSSHLTSTSCTSTPLMGKKFRINEESENFEKISELTLVLKSINNLSTERRQSHESDADKISEENSSVEGDKSIEQDETNKSISDDGYRHKSLEKTVDGKPPLNAKISEKIGTFNGRKVTKCE